MKNLLAGLLLVVSIGGVHADDVKKTQEIPASKFTARGHTMDSLKDVKTRVENKSAVFLDVREKAEWDRGHLKHAFLVPLSDIKSQTMTEKMKKKLVKGKPIYVHCGSGGRVLAVSKLLRAKGYDIRPLKAGYGALVENGFQKAAPEKSEK